MAEAITLRQAVAFTGNFPLLAGVDLDVSSGEVVHLSGANGAGKTSLLRALAGLVPFSAKTFRVLGYDLTVDRRSVRAKIGLIGHRSSLYEDLDARTNLEFWINGRETGKYGIEEALSRVGIVDRLAVTPVARLSTGQRRRVTLALLIARAPSLWLLDEPHAGLDVAGRELLDGLIREAASVQTTVILASHERAMMAGLASREVSMVGGRVIDDQASTDEGGGTHDA